MIALDADTNGIISAAEISNSSAALLKLDANGDGQLTADEFNPAPPGGSRPNAGRPPFVPPILKALDTDGDGVLSAQEITKAPAALSTLDKDSDGQLTRDEIMPARPGGRGGLGGGPSGPGGPPPGAGPGVPGVGGQ